MSKKIKVAIIQRLLPEFRYELFNMLFNNWKYLFKIYFGYGLKNGSQKNTAKDYSKFAKKIFTIPYLFKKYRVIHPTLVYHIIIFNPMIVITEPSTYFPNNFIAFIYSKLFNKRFIWWEAGIDSFSKLRILIEPFIKLMIKHSDAYICYSSIAKEYLFKRYKVNIEKIFIAQNTIFSDYTEDQVYENKIKSKYNITKNDHIISYIGAIEKRKKIDIIINSLKHLNNYYKLFIIGDGPDVEFYKSMITDDMSDRIFFTGRKSINEANHYLHISDFTILPSEGGLAINHSLSVGTPVICGKNDGTEKDLIINDFNGTIINNISPELISAYIINNTTLDRKSIIQSYQNRFSINNMISNIIKCIDYTILTDK